ncbi:DJ-1/PfpI family protein, partial [Listeria monocytogenes]|uniref:DJ-1/PfpI family protein n=1 Tax=Listeria monocytogenes TaxID=1639 RepID=UPI0032046BA4
MLGGSSGLSLAGAIYMLNHTDVKVATAIIPDTGINYLNQIYDDNWVLKNTKILEDKEKILNEIDNIKVWVPYKLNKIANQGVTDKIKEVHRNPNMTIASVCGGGVLLAMADIIKDRHVTAHFMGLDLLEGAGAHVVNARVVDDGDIVSG